MRTPQGSAARHAAPWIAVAALVAASACGASGAPGRSQGGSSGGASSGSGGPGSSSGAASCTGTSSTAQVQPLDIYIMLDRSLSMEDAAGSTTKWAAVSSALSSFVGQPMDGTSVGLQYFPLEDPTEWDGNSCDAAAYASPEVEIGPLSRTAAPIRTSIGARQLASGTPSSPALQGAIDHARSWASSAANAGHAVVVVFATDGEPTTCRPDLARLRAIAAAGVASSPSVRTFVIGVGNLSNLNAIAAAGGTTSAFIVGATGSVGAEFLEALNAIRGQAVGCSYVIPAPPAGKQLDYGLVNVEYQRGAGGANVRFAQVASAAACGSRTGAWHYDSNSAPTRIVLCPGACAEVEADAAATVRVVLGCTSAHEGEW